MGYYLAPLAGLDQDATALAYLKYALNYFSTGAAVSAVGAAGAGVV
jgi:hypothetical protein